MSNYRRLNSRAGVVLVIGLAFGCRDGVTGPGDEPQLKAVTRDMDQWQLPALHGATADSAIWASARAQAIAGKPEALAALEKLEIVKAHLLANPLADIGNLSIKSAPNRALYSISSVSIPKGKIYSSDAYPDWAQDVVDNAVWGNMVYLGNDANFTAEYRVATLNMRDGDYGNAGTDTDPGDFINGGGILDCTLSIANAVSCLFRQQSSYFPLSSIPDCGIDLHAKGTHSAKFTSPFDFSINGPNGGVSYHVGSGDADNVINTQKEAYGVSCDDCQSSCGGGSDGPTDPTSSGDCTVTTVTYTDPPEKIWFYVGCDGIIGSAPAPAAEAVSPDAEGPPQRRIGTGHGGNIHVGIIAVPNLGVGVRARVYRRASGTPHEVVAIDASRGTSADIRAGIRELMRLHHTFGDRLVADISSTVTSHTDLPTGGEAVGDRSQLFQKVLDAKTQSIHGVGEGRVVFINLDSRGLPVITRGVAKAQ